MLKNRFELGVWLYVIFTFFNLHQSYAQSIGKEAEKATSATSSNIGIITNIFSADLIINLIFAIIIIVLTFILSKVLPHLVSVRMEKVLVDAGNGDEIIGVVHRVISVFILFIGFSAMMTVLGLDMTIFLGGLGFGLGYTLKIFLSNFIAGVIMVTQGTYHNGDLIKIDGNMGYIDRIFSLYTRVKQFDGVMYLVPNLKFLEESVSNYYLNDKRRVDIDVQVTYDTDIYKAKQILMKVANNFPTILRSPEPSILVKELAENGVNLTLRCWINSSDNYLTMKSNLTETVNLAFRQSDINIPYKNITITNYTTETKG